MAPTGSIVWIEGRGNVIGQDSQILRSVLGYSDSEPVGGSEVIP